MTLEGQVLPGSTDTTTTTTENPSVGAAEGSPPASGTLPPDAGATNLLVTLPAEILSNPRMSGITSLEQLAKAYTEAKLAPEIPTPDKYVLPEGVSETIRQTAHEAGLTQEQLDRVIGTYSSTQKAASEQAVAAITQLGEAKLESWGENKAENVALVKSAIDNISQEVPGLSDMLRETSYYKHPVILDTFLFIGKMFKEGGYVKGDSNTPANVKSTAEIMYPSMVKK